MLSSLAKTTETKRNAVSKEWGDVAADLLFAISGPHVRKKRRTLLVLASLSFSGLPISRAFDRTHFSKDVTCSGPVHYKWKRNIPEYKAAFDFLVGTGDVPGLAISERETIHADNVSLRW